MLTLKTCVNCGELVPLVDKEGLCPSCVDEEEVDPARNFVVELKHGYRVQCYDKEIYDIVVPDARTYLEEADSYIPGDWSSIRDLLQARVTAELEDDLSQKRQWLGRVDELRKQLGDTRAQRVKETGVTRSPIDLFRLVAERANLWLEQHRGEDDWQYDCTACGHKGMRRGKRPHMMFDTGSSNSVWYPEMLPLLKRYYNEEARYARADYMDSDWMAEGKPYDGGCSVADLARVWNMSPIGVLYEIWVHAAESGDARLPLLRDLVGFTYDIEKPETMRPFLPEGYFNSDDFWKAVEVARVAKKKLARLRQWAAQHRDESLWWIVRDRLLFMDFFGPQLSDVAQRWKTWYAQKPGTLDPISCERNGRKTGKSQRVSLLAIQSALQLSVEKPGSVVLLATPDERHTDPHFDRVIKALRRNEFFRAMLPGTQKAQASKRMGLIRFRNSDALMYFAYAGVTSKDAFSLQQYHSDALIVDEIGKWSWAAERAVLSSVNSQTCLFQKYFGVMVDDDTGMPIYQMTVHQDRHSKFCNRCYHLSEMVNIYDWNLEKHTSALEELGGIGSDAFRRQILGLVGAPSFQEISDDEYSRVCVGNETDTDGSRLFRLVALSRSTLDKIGSKSDYEAQTAIVEQALRGAFPGLALRGTDPRNCIIALDYGAVAPSEIWVLVRDATRDVWKLVMRVEMTMIPPLVQAIACHYLVQRYNPHVFAMDVTGTHNPLYEIMRNDADTRFAGYNYPQMLFPVHFTERIPVKQYEERPSESDGILADRMRLPDGRVIWVERQPAKVWAVGEMHRWFRNGMIELPEDEAVRHEFTNWKRIGTNKWSGTGGADHNIAALHVFLIAHHMKYAWEDPIARPQPRKGVCAPQLIDFGRLLGQGMPLLPQRRLPLPSGVDILSTR